MEYLLPMAENQLSVQPKSGKTLSTEQLDTNKESPVGPSPRSTYALGRCLLFFPGS